MESKWNCPLQCFLAAWAWKPEENRFIQPKTLTPRLAHFLYAFKCIIYRHVEMQVQAGEDLEVVAEKSIKRHLNQDRKSCFQLLRSLKRIADHHSLLSQEDPYITWDSSYSSVAIRGNMLYLSKLRSGIQSAIADLQLLMWNLSDNHDATSYCFPQNRTDSLTNMEPGYSFFADLQSSRKKSFQESLLHDHRFLDVAKAQNGEIVPLQHYCRQWLGEAGKANAILIALIHICGGQPPRGTEAVAFRVYNSADRRRNVFKLHGDTVIIGQYSKATQFTGEDDFTVHYLPTTLESLLDYYLIVIRPVEIIISQLLDDTDAVNLYSSYLAVQAGKKMEAVHYGAALKDLLSKYCNVELGLSEYRQISVAMKREFIAPRYHGACGDEIGDLHAGHTSKTAHANYAIASNETKNFNTQVLFNHRLFCAHWHMVLGFGGPSNIPRPLTSLTAEELVQSNPSLPSTTETTQILQTLESLEKKIDRLSGDPVQRPMLNEYVGEHAGVTSFTFMETKFIPYKRKRKEKDNGDIQFVFESGC